MGKLFQWYTWQDIKDAVWLYRHTRHECTRCCLFCKYFVQCYYDVYREVRDRENGE